MRKLYLYLIFMICINILSIIGLIFITKFSFKATRNKDTYTVNLEEWEYNFTRVTLVFLWISILSKALLILAIGFLLFIPFINLIIAGIMALLVIDIMGIIYLTRFCYKAKKNNNTYSVTLDNWQYNMTKVTTILEWIAGSGGILIGIIMLIYTKKSINFWERIVIGDKMGKSINRKSLPDKLNKSKVNLDAQLSKSMGTVKKKKKKKKKKK